MNTEMPSQEYVREVTARYIGPRRKGLKIREPYDAADFMRHMLRDEAREHFFALYLDGAHQVISFSLVSIGTATSATAGVREVFQPAVLLGAVALVVGHNHPSGELTPSAEDIAVTKRLKEAGDLLGIKLLDHVLFTSRESVSLHERGLMG